MFVPVNVSVWHTQETLPNESEVRAQIQRREDLPEYRQFGHLSGMAIWIGEASRKYNVLYSA